MNKQGEIDRMLYLMEYQSGTCKKQKERKSKKLREYITNTVIPGIDLLPISKLNEDGGLGLNRLLSHFERGFVAVSAYLEKLPAETNKKNTELLKKHLKNSGFGFIPVIGGWKNPETGEESVEETFVIPNKDGVSLEHIFNLGKVCAKQFNQHSFLFAPASEDGSIYAKWYDGNGNETPDPAFKSVTINDLKQEYFTALNKAYNTSTRSDKKGNTVYNKTPKQFTLLNTELYIRAYPNTLNEHRSRREFEGEIFVFTKEEWGNIIKTTKNNK